MIKKRQWRSAPPEAIDSLLFTGAPTLVQWIENLVRRPRWGDRLLPIVLLVKPVTGQTPLVGIKHRLDQMKRIPISRVGGDSSTVEDLLSRVVTDLASRHGRIARLRFPHYSLAVWL